MPNARRFLPPTHAVALLLALWTLPASTLRAQTRSTDGFELMNQPYVVPSVGMSIHLPVGSKYETTRISGGETAFHMVAPNQAWRMLLSPRSSSNQGLTARMVADELIKGIAGAKAVRDATGERRIGSQARLIDRSDDLDIQGVEASRFYIEAPSAAGDGKIVSGYTIFRVSPGQFSILQMDCLPGSFEVARRQYEQVVASARFRDPEKLAAERAAGVRAGDALLESLPPEALASLGPFQQWYRIHRPVDSGGGEAREVAYQLVEFREGHRGDLTPRRPRSRWSAAEHDEGFIVRILGRQIGARSIVDSDSIYFLATAGDEEQWSIKMAARKGEQEEGWQETGVWSNGKLKVIIQQFGQPPIEKTWKTPEEAYCTQVEGYLLPRIFARRGQPGVFNFYRYDTTNNDLLLRRDVLALPEASTEAAWTLRSRASENHAETTTLLDDMGTIIRREQSNGVVIEPIELERLKRIWNAKGLPTN